MKHFKYKVNNSMSWKGIIPLRGLNETPAGYDFFIILNMFRGIPRAVRCIITKNYTFI